jgi:hypothetical protein
MTSKSLLPAERFWAILDILYGLMIAGLAWYFIPISTAQLPLVPQGLVSWGLLHIVLGSLGVINTFTQDSFKLRKGVWYVNVSVSLLTVLIGILLATLCLTSGLYWLGVFGVLGWGVFISSLLLISGVIQCLILYPSLKLKRALSLEYRTLFKGGGIPLQGLKLTLILMVFLGSLGAYYGQLTTVPLLTDSHRDQVTSYLRATLEGAPHTPAQNQVGRSGVVKTPFNRRLDSNSDPLASLRLIPAPHELYVSFYAGGQRIVRVSGRGKTLNKSVQDAARALASHPKLIGKRLKGGRLVIDRVIGESKIPLSFVPTLGSVITSLSVDPGVDGLRSRRGGSTRSILPSDLVEGEYFGVAPIVPGIPELRFGVDAQAVFKRLGDPQNMRLYRIRTEQWVEKVELDGPHQIDLITSQAPHQFKTALTYRGQWGKQLLLNQQSNPRSTLLTQKPKYIESAHLGGTYLINHQNADGRFDYQYFPFRDEKKQPSDARYSIPRHAGAIYGLSLLYEDRALPAYKATATKAIDWLKQYAVSECGGWQPKVTCIPKVSSKAQVATLGHSALSALALLTYMQTTGDESVSVLAHGLVEFLSLMQREDGDFYHRYLLYDGSIEPRDRGMFASEQAAFAFVLAAKQWPSEQWLSKAERALDALTIHKYEGDFLSSFFYGADHWTCLAAQAAFPLLKKTEYLNFCLGYTRFLQRLQYRHENNEGDIAYHGHYGFGFLSPPQAPATGGFTEGVMGTLLLAEAHKLPTEHLQDIYEQVLGSAQALVSDQITQDHRWHLPNFKKSQGAFRRSLVESEVRVDFVQHSLSALLMTRNLNK